MNEIAELLGVSPVYVESEAEYLEEYGFLTKRGEKYLCNILLDEPSEELAEMHDRVYEGAAKIFANELFDALMKERVWENPDIIGGRVNGCVDVNFMMWALVPYIAALSGEAMVDEAVSFDEAATLRPDGGYNICYATVDTPASQRVKYSDSMQRWCGPYGLRKGNTAIWRIDSEWSGRRIDDQYAEKTHADMQLICRMMDGQTLSEEECARLIERGFVNRETGELQCLWIEGARTKNALLENGDRIRQKYADEMDALRRDYIDAVLKETPAHLRRMQEYGLQNTFYVDGWFVLHCLKELVNGGKLKLPAEEQRMALTTIFIRE